MTLNIRLLKNDYRKIPNIYQDFINDNLTDLYLTDEIVYISESPNFPVYMGKGKSVDRKNDFIEAVQIIGKYFINTPRDIHFNGRFWHSYLLSEKREYLIDKYPEILTNKKDFENIVLKKFDWENYIYKSVVAAEYISDVNIEESERVHYINKIFDNLDVFNYIIKYEIFRNSRFLILFLDIVEEEGYSALFKEKIKHLPGDERYGRRVLFELNKIYPIKLVPFMNKEELRFYIKEFLGLYLS